MSDPWEGTTPYVFGDYVSSNEIERYGFEEGDTELVQLYDGRDLVLEGELTITEVNTE